MGGELGLGPAVRTHAKMHGAKALAGFVATDSGGLRMLCVNGPSLNTHEGRWVGMVSRGCSGSKFVAIAR